MKTITRKEIAEKYNVFPLTVANWHNDGKIQPVQKIGTTYLYDSDAVDEFVKSNQRAKRAIHNEVCDSDGEFENGYALTYRGWLAFSRHKKLDEVPQSEIMYQYFRRVADD